MAVLMDISADFYIRSGQPDKGLKSCLLLKRPGVFDLIRDNNLILHVRDQARQLIELEAEVDEGSRRDGGANLPKSEQPSRAIQLLVSTYTLYRSVRKCHAEFVILDVGMTYILNFFGLVATKSGAATRVAATPPPSVPIGPLQY